VLEAGYEGLVAKPEMSAYTTSAGWKNVKVRREGWFLVGGVVRSSRGYFGLLLGVRVGRELQYFGCVEWGVGRRVVEAVMDGASVLPQSPFTDLRRTREVRGR
jgi:ATP-dependent DNA ligase